MSSETSPAGGDVAIRLADLGKCYHIYDSPRDRLKQFIAPPVRRALKLTDRAYFREFWAVKNVSLEIRKGETWGIIGRNGSGKSTLLQLIAGTLSPTTGSVTVDGRIAALLELGSGFNPDFTGRENVFMNGAVLGLARAELEQRFDEIAAFADIGEFIEQPVKTYSSGMMVRLAFAVSVCVSPDILIVDEALAVGDMPFQMKCLDRLTQLTRSGTTLLFVSHDLASVKNFCTKAVYLEHGQIKAIGGASDTAERYVLDMHNAQQHAMGQAGRLQTKAHLGKENAFAIGSRHGCIVDTSFAATGIKEYTFAGGDTVGIATTVEFDPTIVHPALSVIVHDHHMTVLTAHCFAITGRCDDGARHRAALTFEFPANFYSGRYFLTLRLEDRYSEQRFTVVDKQVAALTLHVNCLDNRNFGGMMRLPFRAAVDAVSVVTDSQD